MAHDSVRTVQYYNPINMSYLYDQFLIEIMHLKCCFWQYPRTNEMIGSALIIGTPGNLATSESDIQMHTRKGVEKDISLMEDHFVSTPRIVYFGKHAKFDNTDDFKRSLSNFFQQQRPKLFILYFSGPTTKRGSWVISVDDRGEVSMSHWNGENRVIPLSTC